MDTAIYVELNSKVENRELGRSNLFAEEPKIGTFFKMHCVHISFLCLLKHFLPTKICDAQLEDLIENQSDSAECYLYSAE